MSRIGPMRRALPEAMHHLARRNVAPPHRNIAFVTTFVNHHWLCRLLPPENGLGKIGALDALVRHPGFGVVIELTAVVDRAQMLIGITLLHHTEEAIPVCHRLAIHQVVLVRHRPPDITISCQPRHDVAQIAVIVFGVHRGKAPAVVGVEEDDVGFDAQFT